MDLCSDSDNIEFFSKTDITFFHEALHIRSFSTGVVQRAHTNSGKHISHAPDSWFLLPPPISHRCHKINMFTSDWQMSFFQSDILNAIVPSDKRESKSKATVKRGEIVDYSDVFFASDGEQERNGNGIEDSGLLAA